MNEHTLSRKLGGKWSEGPDAWRWAGRIRWLLSYYLGIGSYFLDGKDNCEVCGGMPSDMDFWMRRVGRRRARCEARECLSAGVTVRCERCGGTGNELLSYYRTCQDCGGSGVVRATDQETEHGTD